MSEPAVPPDPADVSAEYLYLPRPPSHEFRFHLRTLLLLMLGVAVLLTVGRLLFSRTASLPPSRGGEALPIRSQLAPASRLQAAPGAVAPRLPGLDLVD
jgi:hypothetical protein